MEIKNIKKTLQEKQKLQNVFKSILIKEIRILYLI